MTFPRLLRDEEGATLAVTAVIIGSVMAMLALAIDVGMLRTAHAEAQRAADAAALAGGGLYLKYPPPSTATVRDTAMLFARQNSIRNVPVDSSEVAIQIIPSERKVRVRIERTGLSLWFAKLLGRSIGTVSAVAAAAATPAGSAKCVLPFGVPDLWYEAGEDANGNRLWDPGENWEYGNDPGEYYRQHDPSDSTVSPAETGYASTFRDGYIPVNDHDFGAPIVLKMQKPQQLPGGGQVYPGWFFPFQIGSNQGANDYRNAIEHCDPQVVYLNQPDTMEMGNMVGPTRQGVNAAVNQDRTAYWDPIKGVISPYGEDSPRIRIVPMFDPSQVLRFRGSKEIEFNGFGVIFLDTVKTVGGEDYISGRFMYYSKGLGGTGPGGATGPLNLVLRLVE